MKTRQYNLAIPELERVLFLNPGNDTVQSLLIESYRRSGACERGIARVKELFAEETDLAGPIAHEYSRMLLKMKKLAETENLLRINNNLPPRDKFFFHLNCKLYAMDWDSARFVFETAPQEIRSRFPAYNNLLTNSANLKYKKPVLAAALSSLLPGGGKIYTRNFKDAILSFVIVGATTFQAYRGFEKNGIKSVYGWVFGTFAFGFYSGNIYGSFKAAKTYNSNMDNHIFQQAESLFEKEEW